MDFHPDVQLKVSELVNNINQKINDENVVLEGDIDDQFADSDFEEQLLWPGRKRRVKGRKSRKNSGFGGSSTPFLPKKVAKLMGEANMAYVHRDLRKALDIYLQVIRLAPYSHEPYGILGLIWNELGDAKKSFQYKLISFHLCSQEGDAWKILAYEAEALNLYDEAIYCFTRAIKRDKRDIQSIWERSLLFGRFGLDKRVVDSYALMLNELPFNPLLNLLFVSMLITTNEPLRAIQHLEEGLLSLSSGNDQHFLTFWHVKNLVRLYVFVGDYDRLVRALPNIVVWMRKLKFKRINESGELEPTTFRIPPDSGVLENINHLRTFVDHIVNPGDKQDQLGWASTVVSTHDQNLEYFVEEVSPTPETAILDHPMHHLQEWYDFMPFDLQGYYIVGLAKCGNHEASRICLDRSSDTGNLLGLEIGRISMDLQHLGQAIKTFMYLLDKPLNVRERGMAYLHLGRCHNICGHVELAIECYQKALDLDESMDEANMDLAEIYDSLGDIKTSQEYFSKIHIEKAEEFEPESLDEFSMNSDGFADEPDLEEYASQSIIKSGIKCKVPEKRQKRLKSMSLDINKGEIETAMKPFVFPFERECRFKRYDESTCRKLRLIYKKSLMLYDEANRRGYSEFLECAGYLIADFLNNGYFYRGHEVSRQNAKLIRKKNGFSETYQDLETFTIVQTLSNDEKVDGNMKLVLGQALHGLSVEEWHDIVTKFAFILSKNQQHEQGIYVLFKAVSSNIFLSRDQLRFQLYFTIFALGRSGCQTRAISKICRFFMFNFSRWPRVFTLTFAFLSNGLDALHEVSSGVNLKFLLREVSRNPTNLQFLILSGHSYLASKSYQDALGMYIRAHKLEPQNPLVLLLIGITYLSLSVQRVSKNRQFQVIQGLTFLLAYQKSRGDCQESCYNLARYFDHLGLSKWAIEYYKRALIHGGELDFEVGHNLSLLYHRNGNLVLAHDYRRRYCVI